MKVTVLAMCVWRGVCGGGGGGGGCLTSPILHVPLCIAQNVLLAD